MEPNSPSDSGDIALQQLLISMALHTNQIERRNQLLEHAMTVPSLANWSSSSLLELQSTCEYVMGLARVSRELLQLVGSDEEPTS